MIHWSTAVCILITIWFGLRSFSKILEGDVKSLKPLVTAMRLVAFLIRWQIITTTWLIYFICW